MMSFSIVLESGSIRATFFAPFDEFCLQLFDSFLRGMCERLCWRGDLRMARLPVISAQRHMFALILMVCIALCLAQGIALAGPIGAPVSGEPEISSDYGGRVHPITGTYKFHEGIDLGLDEQEYVYSVGQGMVIESEPYSDSGYGGYVTLTISGQDNQSYDVLYGHVVPLVSVGTPVNVGTPVAQVAGEGFHPEAMGSSTGPHCHFQVWDPSGNIIDPRYLCPSLGGATPTDFASMPSPIKIVWDAAFDFVKPLRESVDTITKLCVDGLELLKKAMLSIFFILITIDLVYGATMKVVDSQHGDNFFSWLFYKTMLYLVLLFIIENWAGYVANAFRDFYLSMGAEVMLVDIDAAKGSVANPFDLIQKGAYLVSPIFTQMMPGLIPNPLDIPLLIIALILGLVIFIMLSVITFHIVMAYVEFYVTMLLSFVMFVFSGTKHTRLFASRTFNAIFVACAKLFFFTVFALMLQAVIVDFKNDTLMQQKEIVVASGGEEEVFQTMRGLGMTDAEIAGVMGNIKQEARSYNPATTNGSHTGLFQLDNEDRWQSFLDWCSAQTPPQNPYSNSAQVTYVVLHEMEFRGKAGSWLESMREAGCTTAEECAAWWVENVERSGEEPGDEGYDNRIAYATDYKSRIHGNVLEGGTSSSVSKRMVTVLNTMLMFKLVLIIALFMFIGDRLSKTIISTFSGGGKFNFANED